MISVPFELEQVKLGMLIPGIPLPEKSQKEREKTNFYRKKEQISACLMFSTCILIVLQFSNLVIVNVKVVSAG